MVSLINKKFLVKKSMFLIAGLSCVIALIFNCVSMATDYWIVSQGCDANDFDISKDSGNYRMIVNYGLFKGLKEFAIQFTPVRYHLSVYCQAGEGICFLSCGANKIEQEKELEYVKDNSRQPFSCKPLTKYSKQDRSSLLNEGTHGNEEFMNYHLWVSTVVFCAFTIVFQVMACATCVFNIFTAPIETWQGPIGIYLANSGAAFWNFVTLCVWGDLFNRNLSDTLPIQETILKKWIPTSTTLGYSYWLIFVSMIFNVISCLMVRFRNVLNDSTKEEDHNQSVDTNGAIFNY